MNNKDKGRLGEEIAQNYLKEKKMKILETNYKIKSGEIDIIGEDKSFIVFVEVKARTSLKYGYPSEAINSSKIKKIHHVAKYYLLKNKFMDKAVRFDVIEVYLNENKINHIIGAF